MAISKTGVCKINILNDQALGLSDDKHIKLPYVLPNEEVEFELHEYRGKKNSILKKVINPSKYRKEAECQYFGSCGGCALQHMNDEYYYKYKLSMLKNLLDPTWHSVIDNMVILGPHLRRKAVFKVIKKDGKIFLGFNKFQSHQVMNIDLCSVIMPEISNFIPLLKEELLQILPGKFKSDLTVINTIEGVKWYINNEFHNFNNPYILIDNIPVKISYDVFLQASETADIILQKLVLDGLSDVKGSGIDLFCGRGTFSIPLSKKYRITAIDIDNSSIEALHHVSLESKLDIKVISRNLFIQPITDLKLREYSFAVLNPPRSGAESQIIELGKSNINKIIYVSCNPKTFMSDFKILQKYGYKITKITPIDQFHWSTHLEIVVIITRITD